MQELQLFNKDGVTVMSSRVVAEDFGKRHNDVVSKIEEKLTTENITVKNWFIESTFNHKGNEYTEYLLTRDGLVLLLWVLLAQKLMSLKLSILRLLTKWNKHYRLYYQQPIKKHYYNWLSKLNKMNNCKS